MINTITFNDNVSTNFLITLNKKKYKVHLKYLAASDSYVLDIDEYINNEYKLIISSIPLNIGIDLMLPFRNRGLGRLFCVPTNKEYYTSNPNSSTLRNYYILQWSD